MGDIFAQIAQSYQADTGRGLVFPKPPELDENKRVVLTKDPGFSMPEYRPMETKEELVRELQRLREAHAEFLKDYAPPIEEQLKRIALKEFVLTQEGEEPRRISVPYYGGPTGPARQEYTTEFMLEDFSGKMAALCFKGVDYIAQVYVNGQYVGSHEGFFAPFELDITEQAVVGVNELKVIVKNDHTMTLNNTGASAVSGDKIYAATGPGWDDPQVGWHHCPAGMGIYQDVFVEVRERKWISDLFVRDGKELWIECFNADYDQKEVAFEVSLYGQNFEKTVFENKEFIPATVIHAGVGDTLTEADLKAKGLLGSGTRLLLENGFNRFVFPMEIENSRIWEPDSPWLYQVQVKMFVDGEVKSTSKRQFGLRTFSQDVEHTPKGRFYLNGKEIKLRGANTMGYEQWDVIRGDMEQLIDDMLLAKACNMNFLRITQRPVQEEIYDYCDRLGMMVQTDFPLFGEVRINQFCEVLRQTGEMEKLIRSHPSCILVSYMNEPFPNANNLPHRMISRKDMEGLFTAMDIVVKLHNPERVIKHVDGDYDPPSEGMPDNHCYTMWYNGHGLEMGKLHRGYWLAVKPDWCFGCGEFGAEGLDFAAVMRECYPEEWLKEPFHPGNILKAQTGNFYYFFFDEGDSLEDWVEKSQDYQAFATKIMTTAFRRNHLVNSFAIHLFIDAWPAGWMKTIMDCKRNPKKAFFTYRDKLSPVLADIRSDRFSFFEGETVRLESYVCNDLGQQQVTIKYQAELLTENRGEILSDAENQDFVVNVIGSGEKEISVPACSSEFAGFVTFEIPKLAGFLKEKEESEKAERIRTVRLRVRMTVEKNEVVLHGTEEVFSVYPREDAKELSLLTLKDLEREEIWEEIIRGRRAVLSPLEAGTYALKDYRVTVKPCGMDPVYFVSRKTGHELVEGFGEKAFGYWYDDTLDRLAPISSTTLRIEKPDGKQEVIEEVREVLISGNKATDGSWQKEAVCAELTVGAGSILLCQIDMRRFLKNPEAVLFWNRLARNENASGCGRIF